VLRPRFVSVAYTDAPTDPRVRRQCESLARHGYRVIQVGLGHEGDPVVSRLGDMVLVRWRRRRYRGSRIWRYLSAYAGFFLFAWRIMRRIARRSPVAVVQVTNLPDVLVLVAHPARCRGARVVLDIRDPMPELFLSKFGHRSFAHQAARLLCIEERYATNRADRVFCVNAAHRSATVAHGAEVGKLRVVLNAADERWFPMIPPRLDLAPRLVYHGTVARRMGLDLLLEAVALVRTEGLPVRLDVYGDGDAVPELRQLAVQLELNRTVHISGRRHPMDELSLLIREASVGVVPFIRDAFTDLVLPTKLIEYVRLGLPAIVSWSPTVAHYFGDDMVNFVRPFEAGTLARTIRSVLSKPADALERARRAQNAEVAKPWQAVESEYVGFVDRLAASSSTHSGDWRR
jgi:glycosyltransferase involved in cell wall biosynthesis